MGMSGWSGDRDGVEAVGPTVTRTVSAELDPPIVKNGAESRGAGYLVGVGSRTSRFKRKHQSKLPMIMILIVIILLLSVAIAMTALYVNQKRQRPVEVCESTQCLRSAANLAVSMDPTADPCEDFYQYACGNWAAEHPRPSARSTHDWFQVKHARVQRALRDFLAGNHSAHALPRPVRHALRMYRACVDLDTLDKLRLQPVLDALDMLGLPSYPSYLNVTASADRSDLQFDWLAAVVRAKVLLGMDVLIGFDIFSDPHNSSVYRLALGSPGTTNPFPTMHSERKRHVWRRSSRIHRPPRKKQEDPVVSRMESTDDDDDDERRRRLYKIYYAEVIKAVFVDSDGSKLTQLPESEIDNAILQAAGEYVTLTSTFYELESDDDNDTMTDEYDFNIPEYTATELQQQTDHVVTANNGTATPVWRAYLAGVFNGSDVEINLDEEKILVSDPDLKYLSLLAAFLSKVSVVSIELYIWLQVVDVMVVHTTTDMRALHERYVALLRRGGAGDVPPDEGAAPPRSLQCAGAVNTMLGMAVSYAIADTMFLNTTKPKVELMLDYMKKSLLNLVSDATWMDRYTKEATYDKVQKMRSLIGFPEWLFDDDKLEKYYKGVDVEPDKHLQNLINIVQARVRKGLNQFNQFNNFSWATDPTDVNAFHTFQENTITVPLVMLQYPFYDLGLESLNYGALGTVLGHEITHGFDNIGRQFDQDGNYVPWWSNSTVQAFENRTQCFVQQYSTFYLPEIDEYVDGKRTLSENMADGGGVRAALGAYRLLRSGGGGGGGERALPGFEHLSPEQLFFLSYGNLWCGVFGAESLREDVADVHAPGHVRPRGALQNSAEFARAFRCRRNTTMNPPTRCVIF